MTSKDLLLINERYHQVYMQKRVLNESAQLAKQLVANGKLSNEDFAKLKNADPTKEKVKYVDWMATQWIKQPQPDLQALTDAIKQFDGFSKTNRFAGAANDIQSYKSLEALTAAIHQLQQSEDHASSKQSKNDYDVVVNNEDILIIAPKTHAASRKLGLTEFKYRKCPKTGLPTDSKWCITFKSHRHWDNYVRDERNSFYFTRIKSGRLKNLLLEHKKFNAEDLMVAIIVEGQYGEISAVNAEDADIQHQDLMEYLKIIEPFLDGKSIKDVFVDKKLYAGHLKSLSKIADQNLKKWMAGEYTGDELNLSHAAFTLLPDNIRTIDRSVDLSESEIHSLQNIVKVEGKLKLWRSKIAALNPTKLMVQGAIDLGECKNITSLPRTLHCKSLSIDKTQITSLPTDLHVSLVLSLVYTPIKTIPPGLKINIGWFKGSQVETIPRDFACTSLDVRDTPFARKYSLLQMREMLPNVVRIRN